MAEVYIGLGSNLGDRREHLRYALDRLREHCDIKKVSSLCETEPVDGPASTASREGVRAGAARRSIA